MRFRNVSDRVRAYYSVIKNGEKLTSMEIEGRVKLLGYRVRHKQTPMFLRNVMENVHLKRERIGKATLWSRIP